MSIAIVCDSVCLSVRMIKTKTAENKIAKLLISSLHPPVAPHTLPLSRTALSYQPIRQAWSREEGTDHTHMPTSNNNGCRATLHIPPGAVSASRQASALVCDGGMHTLVGKAQGESITINIRSKGQRHNIQKVIEWPA